MEDGTNPVKILQELKKQSFSFHLNILNHPIIHLTFLKYLFKDVIASALIGRTMFNIVYKLIF